MSSVIEVSLDGTEQHQLIRRKTQQLFQIDIKSQQLQAIYYLLFQNMDLILIAKTGFGKSIIFQAAPLMTDIPGICIILMPLKALQNEQCEKLRSVSSASLVVLNGDNNNQVTRRKIGDGLYTHSTKDSSLKVLQR